MTETTDNYGFELPDFNIATWHDAVNGNFEKIDSLLKTATGLPSVKGAWANSTAYVIGDRVLDPVDTSLWEAVVAHTSAATGTMEDDRILHPTYWKSIATGWTGRGEWLYNTLYVIGDVAYDSSEYLFAVCVNQHTSVGAGTMRDDNYITNWVTIFDGKPAVTDAVAAKNAAQVSAAAALVSENNADASEAGAAASAATATTQAGIATTQAGIATTKAGEAATSAANALNSELNAATNGFTLSMFTFSTTVSYPPASGQVRLNNATQASATRIDVSHFNVANVDVTQSFLLQIQAGSLILLQDRATAANYQIYTATGPAVVSGSDLQIPVVWKSGGTAIANNRPTMFAIGGGGGAASVTTDDNPPAGPLRDGQLWFKSSTGVFYVYYDDGNTSQWVQIGAAAPGTITVDPWASQPIGVPIPVMTHKGAAEPPTTNAYRYVKLTAADAYNTGILTGESVTGSAPLVIATATVNLPGSPLNGQSINLWNTERRSIRAGSAGTKQDDSFQGFRVEASSGTPLTKVALQITGGASPAPYLGGTDYFLPTGNDGTNGTPRIATETRGKNEGVNYYMRIL